MSIKIASDTVSKSLQNLWEAIPFPEGQPVGDQIWPQYFLRKYKFRSQSYIKVGLWKYFQGRYFHPHSCPLSMLRQGHLCFLLTWGTFSFLVCLILRYNILQDVFLCGVFLIPHVVWVLSSVFIGKSSKWKLFATVSDIWLCEMMVSLVLISLSSWFHFALASGDFGCVLCLKFF